MSVNTESFHWTVRISTVSLPLFTLDLGLQVWRSGHGRGGDVRRRSTRKKKKSHSFSSEPKLSGKRPIIWESCSLLCLLLLLFRFFPVTSKGRVCGKGVVLGRSLGFSVSLFSSVGGQYLPTYNSVRVQGVHSSPPKVFDVLERSSAASEDSRGRMSLHPRGNPQSW